jgi:hypothetical protein
MSIQPEQIENQSSKIELNLVRGDSERADNFLLQNGQSRLLSFSFWKNEEYQNPSRWALHFQVWQRAPLQPPLAMVAIPNSKPDEGSTKYMIIVRNDEDVDKPKVWDNGTVLRFLNGHEYFSLQKNRWYRFTFILSPRPKNILGDGSGVVAMWIDGKKILDYQGNWGYSRNASDSLGYFIKLGIYRASQSRMQSVMFDNLVWGPWSGQLGTDEPLPEKLK